MLKRHTIRQCLFIVVFAISVGAFLPLPQPLNAQSSTSTPTLAQTLTPTAYYCDYSWPNAINPSGPNPIYAGVPFTVYSGLLNNPWGAPEWAGIGY